MRRELHLTAELLHAYSRRGNFHSDPDAAAGLGYRRLVAQGMQSAGPAYGLLLDAWGEEFLAHGELELIFVGLVSDGDTVVAVVGLDGEVDDGVDQGAATITVANSTTGVTAVVGSARRSIAG